MKRFLVTLLALLLSLYILICGILFSVQEKLIFFPQKLDKNYRFRFEQPFEEKNIETKDGTLLHGILFRSADSKGIIFYLHGNAGNLDSWGYVADTYTDLNYDVFMLDYRGYGKSDSFISSQEQLYTDIQCAYNELKKTYSEDQIIVLGYSIGTGLAAKLASVNHPKLLILQAPYYSLIDLMRHTYSLLPTFILKYKFETNKYLKECNMPVIIFHGDKDEAIYYGSAVKLKTEFAKQITLITLEGEGHNGMSENEVYRSWIKKILNN